MMSGWPFNKNIHVGEWGDWVSIRIRGGHQEGYVKKIATSTKETPHPPNVPSCCGNVQMQRSCKLLSPISCWNKCYEG